MRIVHFIKAKSAYATTPNGEVRSDPYWEEIFSRLFATRSTVDWICRPKHPACPSRTTLCWKWANSSASALASLAAVSSSNISASVASRTDCVRRLPATAASPQGANIGGTALKSFTKHYKTRHFFSRFDSCCLPPWGNCIPRTGSISRAVSLPDR